MNQFLPEDKKGKNFSGNNSSGKRNKSDFYQTPYWLTSLLLDNEKLKEPILEPACGEGAIVTVLFKRYKDLLFYDINHKPTMKNFLHNNLNGIVNTVITNPPFRLAFEFIQKAKKVSRDKVIMLLPLSYLHGKKRYDDIYQDQKFPLRRVLVFTRYPMLRETIREDGKHETGMQVYAWFVWQKRRWWEFWCIEPIVKWLDNDPFVLRAGE